VIDRDKFWGYERTDGQVGVRNHLLVISTVHCSATVAKQIAELVGGAVVTHQLGCGQIGEDHEQTVRVLKGIGQNPNVGAVLVVGLGCEQVQANDLAKLIKNKPTAYIKIHDEGGTPNTIAKGVSLVEDMKIEISKQKRTSCPISKLVVGVRCGGSDPASGLAANPATGIAADKLIKLGGTITIGTESLYGSEFILAKRTKDQNTSKKILNAFNKLEKDALEMGHSFQEANPSPGNKKFGLTTMTEKALGAMTKGGTSPIVGFLNAGESAKGAGLWMMETRGADVTGMSVQVAGGAQIMIFTSGWGNPIGSPISPVIKVTGNSATYKKMIANLDFDTSSIIKGEKTLEELGNTLFEKLIDVAEGELTKSEILKHDEFAIPRIGKALP